MKPSKAIIAGAAVAGLLTGAAAVRANAASTSSHPGVSLQTVADEKKAATKTRVQRTEGLQGPGRWQELGEK
jgi:hypothetical protein